MARKQEQHIHDWLSLVSLSGLLVSEPVLLNSFPDGPEPVSPYIHRWFRKEWEKYQIGTEKDAVAAQRRWLDFVLETLLEFSGGAWLKHNDIPQSVTCDLVEYSQKLKPNRVLTDESGNPLLLCISVPYDQKLDRPETQTGKWKASPHTKLDRLLREVKTPLGLLTNGTDFRLVYAAPGFNTAHITWTARSWSDEKITLDAFFTLLGRERFFGPDEKQILALIKESQDKQVDVADQLGEQVRSAIEIFVTALDQADRESVGRLLSPDGVPIPFSRLYETALTVMMRMVFFLYAEENHLLPHGEVLYDHNYGISHLLFQLEREHREQPEHQSRSFDAWYRLLAAFRMLFHGCAHPDFSMKPYGGRLFDPSRFPILEDDRFRLSNAHIYQILRKLAFARAKMGRSFVPQRVSYRTLDVEQIGNIYENLLDYTVDRSPADNILVVFKGKEQAIRPVSEIVKLSGDNLVKYLTQYTSFSKKKIIESLRNTGVSSQPDLGLEPDDDDSEDEVFSIGNISIEDFPDSGDPADRERCAALIAALRDFGPFIVQDKTVPPGSLFVTKEGGVRKGTGTYYTPKWVTSFIVEHTLEPLVFNLSPKRSLKSPREILNLKVCDPAMGSGAFLVQSCRFLGDCLVEAWDRIETEHPGIRITPYGDKSAGAPDELLIPAERAERITFARRIVAEKCLYGVDINPLAVDLAKMSLWLVSLSKDKPFTFLDHRLKCGNSLIGTRFGQLMRYPEDAWNRTNAATNEKPYLRSLYKTAKRVNEELDKQKKGQAILDLYQMPHMDSVLDDAIGTIEEIERIPITMQRAKERKYRELESDPKYQGLKRMFDGWSALWFWRPDPNEQNLQPPLPDRWQEYLWYQFQKLESIPEENTQQRFWWSNAHELWKQWRFFHWDIEFPDVFDSSRIEPDDNSAPLAAGFDAMFGNPPYVRQEKLKDYKDFFLCNYESATGTSDLFIYFYERALNLVRPRGRVSYISNNTYMKTSSAENFRNYLRDKHTITDMVDFGDLPVFKGVTTYPAIIVIERGKPEPEHNVRALELKDLVETDVKDNLNRIGINVLQSSLDSSAWRFEDRRVARLREKIMNAGIPLKKYCGSPLYGIKTGLNEAFVIDRQTYENIISQNPMSSEILKPFLEGKDLKPWHAEPRDLWLITFKRGWTSRTSGIPNDEQSAWHWLKDNYSALANHLEPFEERARKRQDKGEYWWELRACDYYEAFEKPKINWPNLQILPKYSLEKTGYYLNAPASFIPTTELFILGILQSYIGWFALKSVAVSRMQGYLEAKPLYVGQIPIIKGNIEIENKVSEIAMQLTDFADIKSVEKTSELNTLLYHLYGLDNKEQRIVEDIIGLTEEIDEEPSARAKAISSVLGLIHALSKPIPYGSLWSAIALYRKDWLCFRFLSDKSKSAFASLTGLPSGGLPSNVVPLPSRPEDYEDWSAVLQDMETNGWINRPYELSTRTMRVEVTDKLPGEDMIPPDVRRKIPYILEALKSVRADNGWDYLRQVSEEVAASGTGTVS